MYSLLQVTCSTLAPDNTLSPHTLDGYDDSNTKKPFFPASSHSQQQKVHPFFYRNHPFIMGFSAGVSGSSKKTWGRILLVIVGRTAAAASSS